MRRINGKRESGNGEMGMLSGDDMDSMVESIQTLIPLGLKAVGEAMQNEVALATFYDAIRMIDYVQHRVDWSVY